MSYLTFQELIAFQAIMNEAISKAGNSAKGLSLERIG